MRGWLVTGIFFQLLLIDNINKKVSNFPSVIPVSKSVCVPACVVVGVLRAGLFTPPGKDSLNSITHTVIIMKYIKMASEEKAVSR